MNVKVMKGTVYLERLVKILETKKSANVGMTLKRRQVELAVRIITQFLIFDFIRCASIIKL